jgi:F1F0 ATPase subunit 2
VDPAHAIWIMLAGATLGWAYFQGLWATVRRLSQRDHPGRWMAASLFLRLALVLVVFVMAARWGGWPALAAALAGFLAARVLLVRHVRALAPESEDRP